MNFYKKFRTITTLKKATINFINDTLKTGNKKKY